MTKTLMEAAEELKRATTRYHRARVDFMKVYEDGLKAQRYPGDAYFQSKFGERTVKHDLTME